MYRSNDTLSERKKTILRSIIDAYISGGEPVGSKYLTGTGQIRLSSATIRNEMAELEEMGYLEQPHTSAGRIPSEKGYRFYVDSLMQSYRMTAEELRELNSLVKSKAAELDGLLARAGRLMSMLTNYTSLTARPSRTDTVISRYKAVRVDANSFLLIMITGTDVVKTKLIRSTEDIDNDRLILLEDSLNRFAAGIGADEITLPIMLELQGRMAGYESVLNPVMKCVYETLNEGHSGDLRLEGIKCLLKYPEYAGADAMSGILGLLEEKEGILDMVSKAETGSVHVYIGQENTVDAMRNSTLVIRTIDSGQRVVGAIGIIGPCRMDYSKVITTIDYLSKTISHLINGEDSGGKDE